jgi:hypothetical protein
LDRIDVNGDFQRFQISFSNIPQKLRGKMKGKLSNPNLILEEVPEAERLQNQNVEEEAEDDGIPFTKKMRIETRKIHNISDTLVNAKLGLGMFLQLLQ